MSFLETDALPRIADVTVSSDRLTVQLEDGRSLSVPIYWYPRLELASPQERARWELFADGTAIEWPDLDEHIGVDGLLAGRRSQESEVSLQAWIERRSVRSESTRR